MKIKKYQMGATITASATTPAAPVVLPIIGGGLAAYGGYKLLEGLVNSDTGYSIGAENARQQLIARNSPIPAINVEANRIAENNAITEDWNRKLANGPYTINYTDGSKMIVTDYNNGYMTIEKTNPSGSVMYGKVADPQYYGADLYNSDAYIYNPTKGTTRAFYDYTANGIPHFKPGEYPVVTSELNPEFFKVRLLSNSEPLFTEEGVLIDQSALGSPAPNDPKKDPKDDKKSEKDDQNKKKNPFKRGWHQAQNNSPEKWHNSWSSLAEKIGYGANKFWQFETSPLGVLGNMFLIGSGAGAYFGLKDDNETSEPSQETNTSREENAVTLNELWRRENTRQTSTDSLKNNKGGY